MGNSAIRGNRRNPSRDRGGCQVEFYVVDPSDPRDRFGLPDQRQQCVDGDVGCDFNSAIDMCGFKVVVCVNNDDARLACQPEGVSAVTVLGPRIRSDVLAADVAALQAAFAALLDPLNPSAGYVHAPPLAAEDKNFCSAPFQVDVELGNRRRRRNVMVTVRSTDTRFPRPRRSVSRLRLTCKRPPS